MFAYPGAQLLFSSRQEGRGALLYTQDDCFLPGDLSFNSKGTVSSNASTVSNLKMKLNVAEHSTAQREDVQEGTQV